MKKLNFLVSVIFLLFVFLSCSKEDTIRGSGNIVTESRDVGSFAKVYNPTSVNVIIREDATQSDFIIQL